MITSNDSVLQRFGKLNLFPSSGAPLIGNLHFVIR